MITKTNECQQVWKMPKWMERYREHIESGCGGQTAEQLMNRKGVNYFNNPLLCELIGMCHAKINLLERLRKENLII